MRWVAVDTDAHCAARVSARYEADLTGGLLRQSVGDGNQLRGPILPKREQSAGAGNVFGLSAPPDDWLRGGP